MTIERDIHASMDDYDRRIAILEEQVAILAALVKRTVNAVNEIRDGPQ